MTVGVRRGVRWLPWAVLVAAAVAALVIGASRGGSTPSIDAETMHIAGEVRCPVCEGQTAAQSQAPASIQIRDQIHAELAAGEKPNQILDGLVAAYGQGILEKPPASGVGLVVWVVPLVVVSGAITGLVLAFRRWRPAREPRERRAGDAGDSGRRPLKWLVAGAGAALIVGGAAWAVVGSSSSRLPGEEITGATVAPQTTTQELAAAQQDASGGNYLAAVQQYQKILAADPNQLEALTGEGWVLAETQQPKLLQEGTALLASAERVSPSYAPAHLYRGVALLSEDDYAGAVPELRWYLAHSPDPTLAPKVRAALAKAEAGVKAAAPAKK